MSTDNGSEGATVLAPPSETTRPTLRDTEDADRTEIVITVAQLNAAAKTTIDLDISTTDNVTNEEVSGKHIHVEREGLIPALNAVGTYLNMVATKMAYAMVDRAQTDPGLAKDMGLDE